MNVTGIRQSRKKNTLGHIPKGVFFMFSYIIALVADNDSNRLLLMD